ncbi:MAG: hypothetical protein LBL45_10505 [Treponema sp.]|jgi:hypothetical protein|nr:hypothetical protein [Treponema sp.]
MKILFSWLKNVFLTVLISTILILFFRYALKFQINIARTALIYAAAFIFSNVSWRIRMKGIKFTKIKQFLLIGIFGWGILVATIMALVHINSFELRSVTINYSIYIVGGILWGGVMYLSSSKMRLSAKTPVQ